MTEARAPVDRGYGVDAPGVIRGMLAAGVAGASAGAAGVALGRGAMARSAGVILAGGALVPLGLGIAMIGYGRTGKYRLRDWMLARHEWRGDETVLDVGTGRGLMAVGAAKRLASGRVIALDLWRAEDLSDNGPEQLRINAEREGVAERIEIVTANARAIPLADDSADVVLSVLCLHNIEPATDRDLACREIARVLKPGGRALIADYVGTARYAGVLAEAGLTIVARHNCVALCRSLMWVVDVRKPSI